VSDHAQSLSGARAEEIGLGADRIILSTKVSAVQNIVNAAKPVGVVAGVDREAGLLQVKTPGGEEALVPFAKEYLVRMDVAGKRIEMRLPEGLLDINAPLTDEERREISERRENE